MWRLNLLVAACLGLMGTLGAAEKPVKVFILAGQSNMEGKAKNALLEFQANDAKTAELYKHLRKNGQWAVRDDVFIKFLNRKGPLTIGFGSPSCTGPELEFGTLLGDRLDEPVLLIKTAWGGHSLYQNFRSPSAGLPSDESLQKELENAQKKVTANNAKQKKQEPLPTIDDIKKVYGSSYRNMLAEVNETMQNYATLFPELSGKKLELAGFFWFQGFNDQFGDAAPGEYAANMKHFIKDVRKDLNAPNLPFVIAAIGTQGSVPASGAQATVRAAQLSMNEVPEFQGNVQAFRTDLLVDKAAEDLFPTWSKNVEEWNKVGSDRPYHYFGSGICYNRIGHSAGEAMLELLKSRN